MNIAKYFPLVFIMASALGACNLEKEVELELPVYESQLVVECYLEPGRPFRLLLSRSAPYFEAFPTDPAEFLTNTLVDDATVTITHLGETYELSNGAFIDLQASKFYNYGTVETVPADYENEYTLTITTADGRLATATARIMPKVSIDSVVVQFNDSDTLARVLTYFTDDLSRVNFYRRMLHFSSLDSIPEQDFTINDELLDSAKVVFGTTYDFEPGDTVINTLFHIEKSYYDFMETYQVAILSNGNPFGQPGTIISNIEGDANAIGIFTGFTKDRVTTVVEK
ncbi:MAG: DUF4249 domain-containing protein [Saprospiraceae bacterium]|nr:DUF4249 domain-containing protein [Saprospiraceae bacterium]MCB0680392.1 DUF4249 domain-containing protein [Saprospiraceae bacterium]